MKGQSREEEICKAVDDASRAVRQLGSLLFEMEVLRSFLENKTDLRYFDSRVQPAKLVAHKAVERLKGLVIEVIKSAYIENFSIGICPASVSHKFFLTTTRRKVTSSLVDIHSTEKKQLRRRHSENHGNVKSDNFDAIIAIHQTESAKDNHYSKINCEEQEKGDEKIKGTRTSLSCSNLGTLGVLLEEAGETKERETKLSPASGVQDEDKKDSKVDASGSWKILEEEISDVNLLIETYSENMSAKKKVQKNICFLY